MGKQIIFYGLVLVLWEASLCYLMPLIGTTPILSTFDSIGEIPVSFFP